MTYTPERIDSQRGRDPEYVAQTSVAAFVRLDFPFLEDTILVHGEPAQSDCTIQLFGVPIILVNGLLEGETLESAIRQMIATTYQIEPDQIDRLKTYSEIGTLRQTPKVSRYFDRGNDRCSVIPVTATCAAITPASRQFADRVLVPLGLSHVPNHLKKSLGTKRVDPILAQRLIDLNRQVLNIGKS